MSCPYPPYWLGPQNMGYPVSGPMQSNGMTLDQINQSMKVLKEIKSQMEEDKKKDPPKPKYPTFTFLQTLALMVLAGPPVGYFYIVTLNHLINNIPNIIR